MTTAMPTVRQRRVFARLRNVEIGGARYTVELTRAGLVVRRRYSRHPATVELQTLMDLAEGQLPPLWRKQ